MPLSIARSKHRFTIEYPINASPKILYPYLASASGLSHWFCQAVNVDSKHHYDFIWDNQHHYAELTSYRTNRSARFVFLDDNRQPTTDANYLDFCIDASELTQEVFLRVVDYSEETDEIELQEMWDSLVQKLREQVGG